ncbi:membrane peptidoglycan carboxypeptidase [Nocardia tenerifensis]|uniref:Membrane peptidoglycan carboxypeptidase n=1 Tax=Nocardia tenerifensis TaxID=228006 RepID=A0A318K2L9_9NOCA|nr:transglycosylase domain-containing protein [Nocardia tenerifensis]PXX65531.1 membrane peptidoglycan carboxypeptidase [Nocardia tenerifensis]
MNSFRKRRRRAKKRPEPAPYTSIAGFNELETVPARNTRPRDSRTQRPTPDPSRPPRTRAQRFRRLVLALFIIFGAVPALLSVLIYWSAEIPDPDSVQTNQIATVLASDGSTVIAKVVPPNGNRSPVPLTEVPQPVRDAMLSAEDRNFYTNPGYSTSGFLRAARDNVLGRDNAGGGSTITQQYVKNAFLGSERTLTRKMRELIIAAKMARQWSKDDILAAYLNTIYYGRGSYGIAAAAKAYFNKPVNQLTLAEGAVLAALVRTPSLLDPETHMQALTARWKYVLNGMVEMGVLSPGNRDATVFPAILPLNEIPDDNVARGPEGLIRAQVVRELRSSGISEHEMNTGALQITTTIDAKAQQAVLDAVRDRLGGQPPELRAAIVSIDPRSGAVRAYFGGTDGIGYDFAQAPLQTGSAFKPFAVIAAQQQSVPLTRMLDSSPVTDRGTKITNVDGESCGRCSMAEALKRSLNTSFYRLTMSMFDGPKSIADAAHAAGIPEEIPGVAGKTLTEDGGRPLNGIVLGQYLVRPIDMASAYATIGASGVYHQPYFVQRVVTGDGRVLLDRGPDQQTGKQLPAGQQRIPRAIAENTAQAMTPIAAYSNGHALAGGRPSAAKTGTTQLGESQLNKDAWMIGFTPSLSTAVWIGTEQSQPIHTARGADIYGSGLPADIWKQVMDGALDGTPIEQFPGAAGAPPAAAPPAESKPSGGPYDILNPPQAPAPREPIVIIPPAPQAPKEPEPPQPPKEVEIFPGLTIPVPG